MSHLNIRDICTTASGPVRTSSEVWTPFHYRCIQPDVLLPSTNKLDVFSVNPRRHFKWRNAQSSLWQLVWSNTRRLCVALTCPSSGSLSVVFIPAAVYFGTHPQRDAVGRYLFLHSQVYGVRALSINCQSDQPWDSINRQHHLTYIVVS